MENPGRAADDELFSQWEEVPDNIVYDNGFKIQWEDFIRHVVADTPWKHDLMEGAKGVQLAEARPAELGGAALGRRAGAAEYFSRSMIGEQATLMATISLPTAARRLEPYTTSEPIVFSLRPAETRKFNCIAFAAAHIVADPLADNDPWLDTAIDWERTIAFATICGTSGLVSPRRWTRRSAAWGSTGPAPRS